VTTRTLCLWCPDWPVVTARRDAPELAGAPVAVMEPGARGTVVRAASSPARAEGVTTGLRRREAETRCAGLVVIDADPAAEARAFEPVARAMEELTPRVVLERPGVLMFPTRGPSRYFGGDAALAERVRAAAAGLGLGDARVGVADGGFAARLAARQTDARNVRVVAEGETAPFLAPWPVAVLRDVVDEGDALCLLLARLGLPTLGDFAGLPVPAVLARFGAEGARAHRLARGDHEHTAPPEPPPPDLVERCELDPPASRVDEAAFAAKGLADRLLARLEALGLACSQVVVEAETEHGERLSRCWRHDGALTAAALTTRVRWQLDGWLAQHGEGGLSGGLVLLQISPDRVVPASGRQLGFWGGDAAATDRADRALARLQGMLGYGAVVTAVPCGGRTPAERVRWVPWGEARADESSSSSETASWPGSVPGPAPARVLDPPWRAALVDEVEQPVTVSGRGDASAAPAWLHCDALPGGGGPVSAWAGPWPHDVRWWDRLARRRRVLWQVVVGEAGDGVACLVAVEAGNAMIEAVYD
jgi:protein ImuB